MESPNPTGKPKRILEIDAAIRKAEGPKQVCAVLKAMRLAALNGDAMAAKIYLERVLGAVPKPPADDSESSPPTVLNVYVTDKPDLPRPVTPETTTT